MIDEKKLIERIKEEPTDGMYTHEIIEAIEEQPKIGEWILCSERMPQAEQEVLILTQSGIRTTAMYEDGTIYEDDSNWIWNDCEFEYDEEKDDCIISEGWWEYRHFNPDDVYNNEVDEKVIAWQPLPEAYKDGD